MKGECIKDKLKYGVALTEKVTGKNLSLPILSTILIEASGNQFLLKGTNLDVGLECAVSAKIETPGTVAVQASMLNNFLSTVSGDEVISLEAINGNLALATKKTSTILKSFPHEDFPIIPRVEPEEKIVLSVEALIAGMRAVLYATSLSDVKPEIASVHIYGDGDDIVFVATDSFRLAEKRVPLGKKGDSTFSLLIPHKNASDLVRAIEGEAGDVELAFNKNQIAVQGKATYFTSRLVSGVYPNYRQIMPTQRKTQVVVEKRDLMQSLKLSSLFSDRLNQITVKVDPKEGVCEVESKNQDTGENTTLLDATLEGDPITMSFNAKYILDCFQSVPEEKVTLSFNGTGKPLVIRGVRDQAFTYLVMPMNR
jgi:DNA polymerase-3 subunit beta